ncbi:MAG: hypothetical protein ABIR30_01475 [Chitinophagaceae bacterium]
MANTQPPVINPPTTLLPPSLPPDNDWFELDDEKTDLENVLTFLEDLPGKLRTFFEEPYFDSVFKRLEASRQFSRGLFFNSLQEATEILRDDLRGLRSRMNSSSPDESGTAISVAEETIRRIGFTDQSLKLKATLLNRLGRKAKRAVHKVVGFVKRPIVKGIRGFLNFLNSILGSLTKLIPGAEAIKEIKDSGEALMALTD